jgi:putative transposase
MSEPKPDSAHQVALFRYGLIAEFVRQPPGTPGLYQRLEAIAAEEHQIPGTSRTRVAVETLRDWIKRYRDGGFDALVPKRRADRGTARALSAAISEALLAIKEDNPKFGASGHTPGQGLGRGARGAAPAAVDRAPSVRQPRPDAKAYR